jgi:hypothetical protein
LFEAARTRLAVLEIMKDGVVSKALYDPGESRRANESAWAVMTGVIMRFSQHPGYTAFMPPTGLSPRQRAIWLVKAFSEVVLRTSPGGGSLRLAITVASASYAGRYGEREILSRAATEIDHAKEHWLPEPANVMTSDALFP